MTEAPSHQIRVSHGHVRVLRTAVLLGQIDFHRYLAPRGRGRCRMCGCTGAYSCIGGCAWTNDAQTVCTRCAERER